MLQMICNIDYLLVKIVSAFSEKLEEKYTALRIETEKDDAVLYMVEKIDKKIKLYEEIQDIDNRYIRVTDASESDTALSVTLPDLSKLSLTQQAPNPDSESADRASG